MNIIETTLTTQAIFSDDNTKHYLLKKVWSADTLLLATLAIGTLFLFAAFIAPSAIL